VATRKINIHGGKSKIMNWNHIGVLRLLRRQIKFLKMYKKHRNYKEIKDCYEMKDAFCQSRLNEAQKMYILHQLELRGMNEFK